MSILIGSLVRFVAYFFAGVGVTSLVDKFVPDKLPAGVTPMTPGYTKGQPVNWMRIIFFVVIAAIGAMILKFLARKLKINFLK